MKRISNEKMATTLGGAFWSTVWECVPNDLGPNCKCRKVYYRFWVKSYDAWRYNTNCAYDGTKA